MERNEAIESLRQLYSDTNEENKAALECLIPELCESEDERIRKELVNFIKKNSATPFELYNRFTPEQYIAYLEKRKELDKMIIVSPEVWDNAISDAFENGKKEGEKQKEQEMVNLEIPAGDVAPAEEDGPFDEDEFLEGELAAFLQNYDKEYDDDAAVSDVAKHFYELGKKVKQKPVEFHVDNPNIQKFDADMKITTSDSSADGKELLYVSNKSYNIGFRDGVASVKPAEWSVEDEKMCEHIISELRELRDWETDEELVSDYENEISWLKSLRSRPKSSDNWKPSEEQMAELYLAATGDTINRESNYLYGLYDDLKKLI